MIGPVKM